MNRILLLFIVPVIAISACKKDRPQTTPTTTQPPDTPTVTGSQKAGDMWPLDIGNWWEYEITRYDSNGNIVSIRLDTFLITDKYPHKIYNNNVDTFFEINNSKYDLYGCLDKNMIVNLMGSPIRVITIFDTVQHSHKQLGGWSSPPGNQHKRWVAYPDSVVINNRTCYYSKMFNVWYGTDTSQIITTYYNRGTGMVKSINYSAYPDSVLRLYEIKELKNYYVQ